LLNDRNSGWDKFDAAISAVWACMELAVIVQVVLTVELVLAAEFT
jgi:hypothetical protein